MNKLISFLTGITCAVCVASAFEVTDSGDINIAYNGKTAKLGSVVQASQGEGGEWKVVLKPTLRDGYCMRAQFPLASKESAADTVIEEINSASQERSYALENQTVPCESLHYFKLGSDSQNLHRIVGSFLSQFYHWRTDKAKFSRSLSVIGSANEVKCARETSELGILRLVQSGPIDPTAETKATTFYIEFSKCKFQKTGEDLAATVEYNNSTTIFTVRLIGPIMRYMHQ